MIGRSPEATRQLASRARRRVRAAGGPTGADRHRERRVIDAWLVAVPVDPHEHRVLGQAADQQRLAGDVAGALKGLLVFAEVGLQHSVLVQQGEQGLEVTGAYGDPRRLPGSW